MFQRLEQEPNIADWRSRVQAIAESQETVSDSTREAGHDLPNYFSSFITHIMLLFLAICQATI